MLKILRVASPDEKKSYFLQNKSFDDLWVVSHIEAKKWIHDQFLAEHESIPTQSVLRATEYWSWLFSINLPDQRVISESLIYALIEEWFSAEKIDLQFNDIEMFFNFFSQSTPLLFLDQQRLFGDWLKQDPDRDQRLNPWWQRAEAFRRFLSGKKWAGRPWLVSQLLEKSDIYFGEHQRVFFDLGWDLQHEEVDLILRLSEIKDVTVFCPLASSEMKDQSYSSVYTRMAKEAKAPLEMTVQDRVVPKVSFVAEPSVLLEVKNCVSQLRSLLDQGVKPVDIAIVSPAIEDYWPLLRAHLNVEGVPANKRLVLRAISLPEVQRSLSRLHLLSEDFQQGHLSAFQYMQNAEERKVSYTDFRKNFSYIYDTEDVRRIFELPASISPNQKLSLGEFIDLLSGQWSRDGQDVWGEIVDRLVKDLNLKDEMTFAVWVKYLELVISRYEITVQPEEPSGIHVMSLNAADWTPFRYLFVLGCEQTLFVQTQRTPLKIEDLSAIERDLGFFLPRTESHKTELDLYWLLQRSLKKIYLSHSETNFQGEPQLAAHFWLRWREQCKDALIPVATTRWDHLINLSIPELSHLLLTSEEERLSLAEKLQREQGLLSMAPLSIPHRPRLSASQLQKFDLCAFQFFASKILRLQVTPEYDLDMDPMYGGQILHAVLEKTLQLHPDLSVSSAAIETIYDDVARTLSDDNPLQKFWLNEKRRHLQMIFNFIEEEKEYRRTHPGVTVVGTEVPVQGHIQLSDQDWRFSRDASARSYAFLGKIDRLDKDRRGSYAIIDYKTSQGGLKAFDSWLEKSQFQMSLYAMAIEAGLGQNVPVAAVSAAEYIFLKNKKRGSGFIVEEEGSDFVGLETSEQLISAEEKMNHITQMKESLHQILLKIEKGEFSPQPKEMKICDNCDWRLLCRAPHLR